jgi:hypothetical protein
MASYSWAPAPGARLISALQTAVARGLASQYPLPTDLPKAWVDLLAQLDNESDCAVSELTERARHLCHAPGLFPFPRSTQTPNVTAR